MPISATGAQGTNECYGAVLEPISAAGAAPNSMQTVRAKESMFKVDAGAMPMPMPMPTCGIYACPPNVWLCGPAPMPRNLEK